MPHLPSPAATRAVATFVREHPCWTAFWDKRHGVWRVTQDDPDSDLYVEHTDADTVIAYMTAHG
jgi:hypothetical protein